MGQPVAAAVVLVNGLSTAPGNLVFGPDTTMCFVPGTVLMGVYAYVLAGLRFAWAAPLGGRYRRRRPGTLRASSIARGARPPRGGESRATAVAGGRRLLRSVRLLPRPDRPRQQARLGLYLVRLIAERYVASARAEDIADGVRFKVLLPLRSPRSRPSVRKSRSDAPVDPEPERP